MTFPACRSGATHGKKTVPGAAVVRQHLLVRTWEKWTESGRTTAIFSMLRYQRMLSHSEITRAVDPMPLTFDGSLAKHRKNLGKCGQLFGVTCSNSALLLHIACKDHRGSEFQLPLPKIKQQMYKRKLLITTCLWASYFCSKKLHLTRSLCPF